MGQEPIAEFSLYLLVCELQPSGTFFPNFIFASDNTLNITRIVERSRRGPQSAPVLRGSALRGCPILCGLNAVNLSQLLMPQRVG